MGFETLPKTRQQNRGRDFEAVPMGFETMDISTATIEKFIF